MKKKKSPLYPRIPFPQEEKTPKSNEVTQNLCPRGWLPTAPHPKAGSEGHGAGSEQQKVPAGSTGAHRAQRQPVVRVCAGY